MRHRDARQDRGRQPRDRPARPPDVPWTIAQTSEPLKIDSSIPPSDFTMPRRSVSPIGMRSVSASTISSPSRRRKKSRKSRQDEREHGVEEPQDDPSARRGQHRGRLCRDFGALFPQVLHRDPGRVPDPLESAIDSGHREDVADRPDVAHLQLLRDRCGRRGRLVHERDAEKHAREEDDERAREGEQARRETLPLPGAVPHDAPQRPEGDRQDRRPEDSREKRAEDDVAEGSDGHEKDEKEDQRIRTGGTALGHAPPIIRNALINWGVMRPAMVRVPRHPPPSEPPDPGALSRAAVESALAHGFVAAGVLAASRPLTWGFFRDWLSGGLHGEMAYLERDAAARMGFDSVLPFTRSVLAVAREVPGTGKGNVAKFARGEDYHRAVRRALKGVIEDLKPLAPTGSHFRVCVDTAPLLEREIAVRAGLGFVGKNGMLIVPGVGSHVVLGEVLTDVTLAPSAAPFADGADRCGTCTACLEACPTQALLAPRVLDARRCLSYLTIEKRSLLTADEEASLDGRLFGCDDCQDVCPFNAALDPAGPARGPAASLDPEEILALDDEGFRQRFFHSAIWRATRSGLQRNARAAAARAT